MVKSSNLGQQYKFGGKEYQPELGLDWYDVSARNYDPALGRWMNIDPLADFMKSESPYEYAFNNPIYYIDTDGRMPYESEQIKQGDLQRIQQKTEPVCTDCTEEEKERQIDLDEVVVTPPKDESNSTNDNSSQYNFWYFLSRFGGFHIYGPIGSAIDTMASNFFNLGNGPRTTIEIGPGSTQRNMSNLADELPKINETEPNETKMEDKAKNEPVAKGVEKTYHLTGELTKDVNGDKKGTRVGIVRHYDSRSEIEKDSTDLERYGVYEFGSITIESVNKIIYEI